MATFTDSFTRANSNSLGSDWTDADTSGLPEGTSPKILSNAVAGEAIGDGGASCNKVSTANHYAQATWLGSHDYYQISVRGDGAGAMLYIGGGDCYHVEINGIGGTGALYRAVNGSWTSLGSVSDSGYTSGQTAYLHADGSSIVYKRNGTTIQSVTDTGVTSGTWTGFKIAFADSTTAGLDDWECEDVSTSSQSVACDADTYVAQNNPTSNFHTVTTWELRGTTGGEQYLPLLKFTLPSLGGATLTAATLTVKTWDAGSTGTFDVRVSSDTSWTPSTVTWNTKPTLSGPSLGQLTPALTRTSYVIDLDASTLSSYMGSQVTLFIDGTSSDAAEIISQDNIGDKPYLYLALSEGNTAPTAAAGADQTGITPNTTVTLDGTGSSDTDGTITGYTWRQISGMPVTLSSTTAAQPTFTAPSDADGAVLVFGLIVTDNEGAQSSEDTVQVTVNSSALIRRGTTPVKSIYRGATSIRRVYRGTTLIWTD